jgi:hypothetical protein
MDQWLVAQPEEGTASVWWKALIESDVGNDNFKCCLLFVNRYEPEEEQWTNGSWPSLRKARLAYGVCVVEGLIESDVSNDNFKFVFLFDTDMTQKRTSGPMAHGPV